MFKIHSKYKPAGDQPGAINELVDGLFSDLQKQTLLGVTGSGKTFTIANVIEQVQRPTLVLAHNKTLAAQLCSEFREFFPNNAVEYFVSYYDYYQPEAYMARTDTYIEKEAQINEEIDRLRHSATQSLLTRRDVIVVSSVSCIYGLGSPKEYEKTVMHLKVGEFYDRADLMRRLIDMQFERTNADLDRGKFRAKGDVIEVHPVNEKESILRIILENDQLSEIFLLDPITRKIQDRTVDAWIFPAKHYVVGGQHFDQALKNIESELEHRLLEMEKQGKILEYERLKRRTRYDLEMIRNIGYCNGIENYSMHFDGRVPGEPPHTLLSYFPEDFLTVIDESHVTVPQIRGMYAGDQARKESLVEHGFRLPSAKDNRPLKFDEFEKSTKQTIYVSATPSEFELSNSEKVVEQIVRPTGLIDPECIIMPVTGDEEYGGQIEDLLPRIQDRVEHGERALVTTLTKKMAEDLTSYLQDLKIKVQYIHSDVETLERIKILSDLRRGAYDVIVGVNLLREGLDLPEVTLVAILDADKEGFLRSETSLIQTIGRAARNVKGQVILYADKMTGSLQRALDETSRRRKIQIAYNEKHGITPVSIIKKIADIQDMVGASTKDLDTKKILQIEMIASSKELKTVIAEKIEEMEMAAANLNFETAALLRDEISVLEAELKSKKNKKGAG
jgi:excinuclease ABC subunit B